jgi:hypothetical protein
VPEVSSDDWDFSDASKVKKSIFSKSAEINFYGCHQGAPGGLAEQLNGKFGLRTTGSDTKTDYSNNVGKRWKPNGHYVEN